MSFLAKMLPLFVVAAVHSAASAAPVCSALVIEQTVKGADAYQIDKAWSGTRVAFSGIVKERVAYIAYYDRERWLTVAEINFQTKMTCRQRLSSQFGGWDSHNGVTLAMAGDGTVHVSANMHNTALTLANTDTTGSIATFKFTRPTSADESIVTYPTFIRGLNGDLLFLYRSGRSGNGKWLINRWTERRWERLGEIFAGKSQQRQVSAYPSQFIQDATGSWHFAIVWRTGPDVSANIAVSYANTRDFHVFYGADRRRLSSPLTPESADTVETPGENSGLMNSASIILDKENKPIVVYTRYGKGGRNAIVAARPQGSGWMITDIANSKSRTQIAGGGTLNSYPQFRINSDGSTAAVYVAFPNEHRSRVRLNLENLMPTDVEPAKPSGLEMQPALPQLPLLTTANVVGMVQPSVITSPVRDVDRADVALGSLQWVAQPSDHDQPRKCGIDGKTGCNPPAMPLMLVMSPTKN
jgi:hypothetical protein